ncbi:MAG: AraC family transcriptional regulator [Pseudodesulfovibrio sp.]
MSQKAYMENTPVMLGEAEGNLERVLPTSRSGCNITWDLPARVGTGAFATEFLPSGMTLTVSRCKLQKGLYARLRGAADDIMLVFGLSGRSVNKNDFFKQGFEIEAGSNYLYWFPDSKLIREAPKDEQMDAVALTVPMERFVSAELIGNSAERFCREELPGLCGSNGEFCFQKNINSLSMGRVLEQIIHCPFLGRARLFFLEAKALELIALKLDTISGTPATPEGMNDAQMQGVLAARDLLLKDIQSPPTIHELARAAGMSHPRLNRYFRLVFDCTPFELLRRKRLQWACEMVGANELSLTEIAYAAGYSNASHFSKAFLDYYGVQPGQYRKRKIGSPFYSLPKPIP